MSGSPAASFTRSTSPTTPMVTVASRPVRVGDDAARRVPGQHGGQRADPRPRRLVLGRRAGGAAGARGIEVGRHVVDGAAVPGVEGHGRVGGVEHHRPDEVRVVVGEHLGEPRAVGVAVQIDGRHVEGPDHLGHVGGRGGRGEEVRGVHVGAGGVLPPVVERRTAAPGRRRERRAARLAGEVLHPGAVDGGRVAGAPQVHGEEVPVGEQRPVHDVVPAAHRSGGGIARTALHRQQGARRRAVGSGGRIPPVGDGDVR